MSDWREWTVAGRPWQDLTFAVGEVVFLASLVPMLFDPETHIPVFAGLGTGMMLYAFLVAHVSYRNWITVALTTVTATLWVLVGLGVHVNP